MFHLDLCAFMGRRSEQPIQVCESEKDFLTDNNNRALKLLVLQESRDRDSQNLFTSVNCEVLAVMQRTSVDGQ
jgi:hypothetical protein